MGSSYGFLSSVSMENNQQSDKTRMQVQARSEGDGMEMSPSPESQCTNDPPFSTSAHYITPGGYAPLSVKRKEPKFIPYEPYKAAVSPIIPSTRDRKNSGKVIINQNLIKPLVSKVIKESSTSFSAEQFKKPTFKKIEDESVIRKPICRKSESKDYIEKTNSKKSEDKDVTEFSPETMEEPVASTWLQEKVLLEDRIQRLEEEKKEMASQFSIQIKVNADLKKLLIASLGEDMQAKVQYMSEDKAKLGEHVLFCSQKLSQNKEELDKLSLQRDMWKSKFEASSLLVDELAGWKVVLSRKFNEATETIQCLLEEHQELNQQLVQTFSKLLSIEEAFDPSAKRNSPCPESPWNLSQLASATRALSEDIQIRLLGTAASGDTSNDCKQTLSLSHGEQLAKDLLDSLESLPELTKQEMRNRNGMRPGTTACSVLPHNCNKETTVNCCKHCSGKVHYI